jgi:hypothetical protein
MTTINQLSAADSVTSSDQVLIYQSSSGDARKAAVSLFADYIQSLLTASGGFQTQYAAPNATGFSVTIAPATSGGNVYLLLTQTAGFAAGTIVLPAVATVVDGQEVLCSCTQVVTALTVSGNGAVGVNGAPTTLAANAFFRLRYNGVFNCWYRVG